MQIEPVPLTKEQHEEIKKSVKETVDVDHLYQAERALERLNEVIHDLVYTPREELDVRLLSCRISQARRTLLDYILYTKFKKVS